MSSSRTRLPTIPLLWGAPFFATFDDTVRPPAATADGSKLSPLSSGESCGLRLRREEEEEEEDDDDDEDDDDIDEEEDDDEEGAAAEVEEAVPELDRGTFWPSITVLGAPMDELCTLCLLICNASLGRSSS